MSEWEREDGRVSVMTRERGSEGEGGGSKMTQLGIKIGREREGGRSETMPLGERE